MLTQSDQWKLVTIIMAFFNEIERPLQYEYGPRLINNNFVMQYAKDIPAKRP